MTLNVPLPKRTIIRLPIIKQGLREGLNYTQIGERCGVTEKTIDRDMTSWVNSGLFEQWLKTEFVELHEYARQANPIEAYKEISKIVGRMVTRKTEVKEEINVREEHAISITTNLSEYDSAIEEELTRILRANRNKQQVDTAIT